MENLFIEFNFNRNINTIIVPGYLQTIESYHSIIETLKPFSNIIFYNIFEFGFNEELSLNNYSTLLYEKIKHLENIILLGHSFGGRIIFSYLTLFPNNHTLILLDVAGIKYHSLKLKYKIFKYKLLKHLVKDKVKLSKKYSSKEYNKLTPKQKIKFKEIINTDYKDILKYINNNTLIIWGKHDQITPLKIGKIINKKIKNSGLVVIPEAGHFPHMENIEYFNKILISFYNSLKEGIL